MKNRNNVFSRRFAAATDIDSCGAAIGDSYDFFLSMGHKYTHTHAHSQSLYMRILK